MKISVHIHHILALSFQNKPILLKLVIYQKRLRENIIEYDSCYTIKDVNRIIDDYIFLCYFLGNDFLPHMPGISLKDGGHELLLNTYISILVNYQEYFILCLLYNLETGYYLSHCKLI